MIRIDIISDTVCPWCFIGKRRLERAIAERPGYDYRIEWRPFQLNPDLGPGGMDRRQYLALKFGGRERARRQYDHVIEAGAGEKLAFDFEAIRQQPNTFDSHRLILWAGRAGVQDAVVESLFRRYFLEGANIGDAGVLVAVAGDCGMDGGEVRRWLNRDVDAERVRQDELTARRRGVNGVPCFIVNQKYAVSGAQDPSILVNVFDVAAHDEESQAQPQAAEG